MFDDADIVTFASFEKSASGISGDCHDSTVQTSKIDYADQEVQAIERRNVEVLTDIEDHGEQEFVAADFTKLAEFLNRIEAEVIGILKENIRTANIFSHMDNLLSMQKSKQSEVLYKFRQEGIHTDMTVQRVAWNCSGTLVAVAYGVTHHDDWCEHASSVCIWSTTRRHVNAKASLYQLDVSSCVTCVQFHPTSPGLISAGLFTGQIYLWNLNSDDVSDRLIAEASPGTFGSKEPVTCLAFGRTDLGGGDKKHGTVLHLISASLDGRLTVWQIADVSAKQMVPLKCFSLVSEYLPRVVRGTKQTNLDKEVGITALGLFPGDDDNFIIGTEPGAVFECTFSSRDSVAEYSDPEAQFIPYSPVAFAMRPQKGPINSVTTSQSRTKLFATCGGDGIINFYTVLKDQPSISIDLGSSAVVALELCPHRQLLLLGASADNRLFVLDLCRSRCASVHSFSIPGADKDDIGATCLAFNPDKSQPGVLAIGDSHGGCTVIRIGDGFVNAPPNEDAVLQEIFAKKSDS